MSWLASVAREVLRTNRLLPAQMRALGDTYAMEEFKQMRSFAAKGKLQPGQQQAFVTQWRDYCEHVRRSHSRVGKDLEPTTQAALTKEQQEQLRKLQQEAAAL